MLHYISFFGRFLFCVLVFWFLGASAYIMIPQIESQRELATLVVLWGVLFAAYGLYFLEGVHVFRRRPRRKSQLHILG